MKTLHVDIKDVLGTVSQDEINKLDANAASALDKVLNGTGAGSDFLGWVNLPTETTDALLDDIVATAESLRRDCDTVVAIGIGGSQRQLCRIPSRRTGHPKSALRRPEHRRRLSL